MNYFNGRYAMKLILNDLSYDKNIVNIPNKYTSKECINTFVELLFLLQKERVIRDKGDIESLQSIISVDFACNYNFQKWLNDYEGVKLEHKTFLKRAMDKYIIVVNEETTSEFCCKISEMEYGSKILHKVIEKDCNALSFKTVDIFSDDYIKGIYRFLDEKQDELKEENKEIPNICDNSRITYLKEECKKVKYSNVTSGYDFWEYREYLFPNLIFCDNVKTQIYTDPGMNHINAIIKRLDKLDYYYNEHTIFDIKLLGFSARNESDSVKNNSKLKELRKFKKPNGLCSYFYNHISFYGNFNGRIYFEADDNLKKIYIGYIGTHLPTARY